MSPRGGRSHRPPGIAPEVLHDLIVHSWDIDHTLDPPASIPTDLVRWGLDELADNDSLTRKHFDLAMAPIPEGAEGCFDSTMRMPRRHTYVVSGDDLDHF